MLKQKKKKNIRDLKEEIYMKQLEGYVILGQESKVCEIFKSLYGLKYAPK